MRRGLLIGVTALLAVSPALLAQRNMGMEFHGTPGSVTSPGLDGRLHGMPGSVTDPTPLRSEAFLSDSDRFRHFHGNVRENQFFQGARIPVVAVPYYVPYYGAYAYDSSYYVNQAAVPPQQPAQPTVIVIKDETSRRDDNSRYGEHGFDDRDSRESSHEIAKTSPGPAPQPVVDDSPLTTIIFRDGHKTQIRNYAIVGANLIDLSKGSVLKKIPLASLDLDATRKENEENGIDFHLP